MPVDCVSVKHAAFANIFFVFVLFKGLVFLPLLLLLTTKWCETESGGGGSCLTWKNQHGNGTFQCQLKDKVKRNLIEREGERERAKTVLSG